MPYHQINQTEATLTRVVNRVAGVQEKGEFFAMGLEAAAYLED